MLGFMRRYGFAETTCGDLEPGLVRVERSVDRSLPVAQAAGSLTRIARRVRRLLHALLPSPGEVGSVFQPF
jgi:hypothetical protein